MGGSGQRIRKMSIRIGRRHNRTVGKTLTPEMLWALASNRRREMTIAARSGFYTIKVENGGLCVNNAGFIKKYETEIDVAKALFLDDHHELCRQLARRGGVVHVVIRGDMHWYC
jgi:hypothetical protein